MEFIKINNTNSYKLKNIISLDIYQNVIEKINKGELDVYAIDNSNKIIGRLFVNYINGTLDNETIFGKRVYISYFFLKDEYRNKGLGTKLLDYTLKDLKEKGYTEFTVGVEEKNEIAKHIYFKYGFTKAIDYGKGDDFDPTEYTLYLKTL